MKAIITKFARVPLCVLALAAGLILVGCGPSNESNTMTADELTAFATRYTAAWSSQDPASVAAFFASDGSLQVNDADPAVGRGAITEVAVGFMTAFPDMVVLMDGLEIHGDSAVFHWTLDGTNSGPGGTGKHVRISGYEEWLIGNDGLIAESKGHFDAQEYARQLEQGFIE